MINKITYKDDDGYCFFENDTFLIKPLTLLVGDQGCGKSTLLSILKNKPSYIKFDISNNPHKLVQSINFDTDSMDKLVPNPNDAQGILLGISSKFQSHGENILPIVEVLTTSSDTLILLDEPETALSPRSIYYLINVLKEALTRNNQIIIATHNIMLMQAFNDCILSLEHKKYMTYDDYLETQKHPSDFKEKRNHINTTYMHCIKGNNCTCANNTGWYNNKCEYYVKRGMYKKDVQKLMKEKNIKL